jgi:hypothetical protein
MARHQGKAQHERMYLLGRKVPSRRQVRLVTQAVLIGTLDKQSGVIARRDYARLEVTFVNPQGYSVPVGLG